jgi:hypothetical protein
MFYLKIDKINRTEKALEVGLSCCSFGCVQIDEKLRIWSHFVLPLKSHLMNNKPALGDFINRSYISKTKAFAQAVRSYARAPIL